MSAISAAIYGIGGEKLTADECAFFADAQPYGYILFQRNCRFPEQVKRLVESLKTLSGRRNLPVLIDQEGGRVARLRPPHWNAYPPAAAFAHLAERHPEAARLAVFLNARLMADDLSKLGVSVDCAPVADLPVAGAHDVIGDRAFGHTPAQVIALAGAQAEGLMAGGIVPVLKHIPGHGRARADSHEELPTVDASLEALRASDFLPFGALSYLPMAMTAHVRYTALDEIRMATLSPLAISLIRDELGFDGLLMSDDVSMKAMKGDFSRRAHEALAAGCDVVLHCNGDLREMRAVANGVGALSGKALARAEAAMACAGKARSFDAAAARAEIAQLLTMGA